MSGYLKNCYLQSREGDAVLFRTGHRTIIAHLDGYAIIPMEQYDRFVLIAEEWLESKGSTFRQSAKIANAPLNETSAFS